jgi:hypothetical protein
MGRFHSPTHAQGLRTRRATTTTAETRTWNGITARGVQAKKIGQNGKISHFPCLVISGKAQGLPPPSPPSPPQIVLPSRTRNVSVPSAPPPHISSPAHTRAEDRPPMGKSVTPPPSSPSDK